MENNRLFYSRSGTDYLNSSDKRKPAMAEIKMVWVFLAHTLGIPVTLIGIIANWDNASKIVPIALSAIYLILFIQFKWKRNKQILREKDYDLWHKEMDKREREADHKKRNGK